MKKLLIYIKSDTNGRIISANTNFADGVLYKGYIPIDFFSPFYSDKYIFIDGIIMLNPNYIEPEIELPIGIATPTTEERLKALEIAMLEIVLGGGE